MPAPSFEQILDEVATAEAALAQNGAGPRSSPGFWSAFAPIVPPRSATAGSARKKPVTPEPMDLPDAAEPPSDDPDADRQRADRSGAEEAPALDAHHAVIAARPVSRASPPRSRR